jgi:hypothetical protein
MRQSGGSEQADPPLLFFALEGKLYFLFPFPLGKGNQNAVRCIACAARPSKEGEQSYAGNNR